MESEVQVDAETGEESDVQVGAETEVLENIRRCLRGTASVSTVLRDIESQLEYIRSILKT
ncbi:MAG: hypothetical protein ACLR7D_14505 [Lachnospira eligens]